MEGRTAGDKFRAVIPPQDGYGQRLPNAQQQVARNAFPDQAAIVPGKRFAARGPDGTMLPLWVVDASGEQVVMDFNHPLAGETLTFDVEVVAIRDATDQELKDGYA
jgi:FKBP-type peptidyl-prolyl cis-trans isomerase SlyD